MAEITVAEILAEIAQTAEAASRQVRSIPWDDHVPMTTLDSLVSKISLLADAGMSLSDNCHGGGSEFAAKSFFIWPQNGV